MRISKAADAQVQVRRDYWPARTRRMYLFVAEPTAMVPSKKFTNQNCEGSLTFFVAVTYETDMLFGKNVGSIRELVLHRFTKDASSLTDGRRQSLKPAPKVAGFALTFFNQLKM
jgi:hypothetical protein